MTTFSELSKKQLGTNSNESSFSSAHIYDKVLILHVELLIPAAEEWLA